MSNEKNADTKPVPQRRPDGSPPPAATPARAPRIGEIVFYVPEFGGPESSGARSKAAPYPAIVTHVWADNCVNLHVFVDGSFELDPADRFPTSVMLGSNIARGFFFVD